MITSAYTSFSRFSISSILLLLAICFFCSGCSNKTPTHGYNYNYNKGGKKPKFILNVTKKSEVIEALGSPTIASESISPKTFVYIQQKLKHNIASWPETVDQRVVEIRFNNSDIVTSVREYRMNSYNKVPYLDQKINVEGNKMSIIEQFAKNIGRFEKTKTKQVR